MGAGEELEYLLEIQEKDMNRRKKKKKRKEMEICGDAVLVEGDMDVELASECTLVHERDGKSLFLFVCAWARARV